MPYIDNTSPTIDDLNAIETDWNTFLDNFYATADARYADIRFSDISIQGSNVLIYQNGIPKLHATTNEPLFTAMNYLTLSPIELPRDALNALRMISHKRSITDAVIEGGVRMSIDKFGCLMAMALSSYNIPDTGSDPVNPGMTTLLAANKVTIRKYSADHVWENGHTYFGWEVREVLVTE